MPVHFVGVLAEGKIPAAMGLGYSAGVGNGRGERSSVAPGMPVTRTRTVPGSRNCSPGLPDRFRLESGAPCTAMVPDAGEPTIDEGWSRAIWRGPREPRN